VPTRLSINSFGVKLISQRLKRKVTEKGENKKVRVPGLPEFVTTADSEASDAESPRFEGVAGAEILADVPSGVGTAPMEDVEVEEVEEEDPDVYFKRKWQGESRKKRVVKKPRRYTPTVIAEGESAAVPPPPALLVIKLSAQKQTTNKDVPGLGKTSFIFSPTCTYIFQQLICLSHDQEPRLQENQELRLQENRGDIMILYLLIRKATRLATSPSQKFPEVTRLMSVLRVLEPRKRVQWPQAL